MSRSVRTCRICGARGAGRIGQHAPRTRARTHLVHLEKRLLLHLLERHDLVALLVTGEVYLAVAALADLGEDVELVELQLRAALAEQDALAALVRAPLGVGLLDGKLTCRDRLAEGRQAALARVEIREQVKVVVVEVWAGARVSWRRALGGPGTKHAQSWATSALRLTSALLRRTFSHSLKPWPLRQLTTPVALAIVESRSRSRLLGYAPWERPCCARSWSIVGSWCAVALTCAEPTGRR